MSARLTLLTSLAALILVMAGGGAARAAGHGRAIWVTTYYPGWIQKVMPAEQVDFHDTTCVINFSLIPRADGSIDTTGNGISDGGTRDLIRLAHNNHRPVLICIGGENSGDDFYAAFATHEQTLIDNLVNYVRKYGYDGVDVDAEPIEKRDADYNIVPDQSTARIAAYQSFIRALRASLKAENPASLLTAAAEAHDNVPAIFAPIAGDFDQINVMTYTLTGSWDRRSWFDSALYGIAGQPNLLSCSGQVGLFVAGGIPPKKLGMGIEFGGLAWSGATGPNQPSPGGSSVRDLNYADIMTLYYRQDAYHWDSGTAAPYLALPAGTDGPSPVFLAYEDAHSATAKVRYAQSHGLGGVIIWQLADAFIPSAPTGATAQLRPDIGKPLVDAIARTAGISGGK